MVTAVTAATAAATMKKPVAEDDFESQQKRHVRQPEMCVDYLSYTFDEMDLAASWRVMTKQKKDVVDGIRLENASWRTWAKQRNNLKTISPQTLNWLKDSDVTWLYGPLHTVIRTEEDPFLTPRQASTEETLGLMITPSTKKQSEEKPILKSALKKVTTADLLKRSASELAAAQQPAIAAIKNRKQQRKISISDVNNELHAVSPVVLANHRQPRLRFNHQVEQCIALTDEEEREHEDIIEEEEEDLEDLESEGDEDTDQIITSHITYKPVPIVQTQQQRKSIKKIAPARLKKSQSDADTDDASSILSTSTASSVGFTRSPVVSLVSSPVTRHLDISDDEEEVEEDTLSSADDEHEEEEEEHELEDLEEEEEDIHPIVPTANSLHYTTHTSDYSQQQQPSRPRPVPIRSNTSSSSSIITQTKIAEPTLVTTHSTATDIQSTNGKRDSNLFNHIATWAASYLWRSNNGAAAGNGSGTKGVAGGPSPQSSVSTSILPSSSSAIPIERSYAPPTSSNHSSL